MIALPANAKIFSIGPRVGVNVSSLKFDKELFDSSNRAGFTAGVQAEVMIPITNIGFDLSAMYVHRTTSISEFDDEDGDDTYTQGRDYIEIPLNFKWKIGLPIVGNIVAPYVFTGPSFSILASKKEISEFFESKAVDVAWNFGVGVQLFSHLQVGASYGLGLTDTMKFIGVNNLKKIDTKSNCWTITAAWLF